MWIGDLEFGTGTSSRTKEAPNAGRSHGLPATLTLKDDEDTIRCAIRWAFQVEIFPKRTGDLIGKWQGALAVPFPAHPDSGGGKIDIGQTEQKRFLCAQAAEKHEQDDCEVAVAIERAKEHVNLGRREGFDQAMARLNTKRATARPSTSPHDAELRMDDGASGAASARQRRKRGNQIPANDMAKKQPSGLEPMIDRMCIGAAAAHHDHPFHEVPR